MNEPLYYSQNGEDRWIAANLGLPEKGFYVDIGCAHPFTTSNTAFLRDRKWEGLAIDGSREWMSDWVNIPAFCCAVISPITERVMFWQNGWWSRFNSENGEPRYAITIEDVLAQREVGKIDFLSIDTEGSELDILQSFDFNKHDPTIVVVEYNAGHLPIVEPDLSPIRPFMHGKGYTLNRVFEPVNMIFSK